MTLARNSAYSFAGMALPVVVSIVTVPLYISEIGPERYGALAIAWLILGYFGQADFGAGRAVMQRVASMREEGPAKIAGAIWSALTSMIGFGAVGAIVLFGFAYWYFSGPFQIEEGLRAEMLSAVWLLALCAPLVFLNGVLAGALIGIERFRLVAFAQMLGNSCLLIFPLLTAYFITDDLAGLITAALVARLLGLLIVLGGAWHALLRGHPVTFSRAEFVRLARFGGWVMVSAMVGPFMAITDRFVIGVVENAVAVAAYAIPFQIATRLMILPIAIIQALFPRFAAEDDGAARERGRNFAIFVAQLFTPFIVGAICLAEPLLKLWLGDQLDPRSVPVAQIVLCGVWANAISHVSLAFLQARGDPRFIALLHVAELPVYAVLLIVLGSAYGLVGFALAYALRCLADCLLLLNRAGALGLPMAATMATLAAIIASAIMAANTITDLLGLLLATGVLCGMSLVYLAAFMPHKIRQRIPLLRALG